MKKLLLFGVPLLALFVVAPMLVAVLVGVITTQAASCAQQLAAAGTVAAPLPRGGPGTVQVTHANLTVFPPTVASARGALAPPAATRVTERAAVGDARELGLSATQWKRAAQVVGTGKAMGVPEEGIVIALAVASQESRFQVYANDGRGEDLALDQRGITRSLRLPHDAVGTDHGSLGVFQQQWPWWGSMEQLMDPAAAATKFYAALLKVPGWQELPLTVAAQTVQRSAYPDAYADDEPLARAVYATLADTPATDLYLASVDDAMCALQAANSGLAGAGTVVFPVPADLADADQHNWGLAGSHWSSWHTGTDFSVPCGTPVLASHGGTVTIDTSQSWAGPWLVKVSTGPRSLTTWYAHMQKVLVADGQVVQAGQQLGEVGAEGNATGCHLHFEVHEKNGSIYGPDNIDPSTWLAQNVGRALTGPGSFVIATFNALGHTHTAPGGNWPGWADSATRTRGLAALLAAQAPDVVGLQEFQAPQARVLRQLTGATWGTAGNRDNVLLWRRSTFEFVSGTTVPIPYFGGRTRLMPLVRLRHLPSGVVIAVLDVHNPADARGPAGRWRAEAIRRERAAVATELVAGRPVFLVGDLNDRAAAFCAVTSGGLAASASGGSWAGTGTGGCSPPPRMGIDWIFGTGATFSGYLVDDSPRGRVSDHPYVEAVATPFRH